MSASFNRTPAAIPMSQRDFAILAGSRLAYVRQARSEDVAHFCPEAPVLAPGQEVFVLFAADGTPILVTDSLELAKANAEHEQLEAVQHTLNPLRFEYALVALFRPHHAPDPVPGRNRVMSALEFAELH